MSYEELEHSARVVIRDVFDNHTQLLHWLPHGVSAQVLISYQTDLDLIMNGKVLFGFPEDMFNHSKLTLQQLIYKILLIQQSAYDEM